MEPTRWRQVRELVADLIPLDPDQREQLLVSSRKDDPELVREAESLLDHEREANGFLSGSALSGWSRPGPNDETPAFAAGERIGRYRVLRPLGRGGMGRVYLAERDDEVYQQQVAIKVLHEGLTGEEPLRRFAIERQILADLQHPDIARLLDGGTLPDGRPYMVLEALDGLPITEHCRTLGLALTERLRLLARVARAVHFAHQNLVIHRDLKPSNILVTADGEPKLLDFGIAKLVAPRRSGPTSTATHFPWMPLTPEYASPEQLLGEPVSTATDVYSLGVLLFELVAHIRPYAAREMSTLSLLHAVAAEESPGLPPVAGLPRSRHRELEAVCRKALSRHGADRYESAASFAADLDHFLAGHPVTARNTGLFRLAAFLNRNRRSVGLGLAATLVSLAVLVGWLIAQGRERRQAEQIAALTQEAEGMDAYGQIAALYPLSGERLDRRRLSSAMERVQSKLPELSGRSRAVAYWVLARGEVTVRRLEQALAFSDQAIAVDKSFAPAYNTRAYVLMRLFFEASSLAALISDEELAQQRRQEAERRFGGPAMELFLAGRSATSTVQPALIEAWIALKEQRFDEARKSMDQACANAPLLHELVGLRGEIEIHRGLALAARGQSREAEGALMAAGPLLEEALAIGRSSAGPYSAECNRRLQLAALRNRHRGELPLLSPDWIRQPCDLALLIQHDQPFVLRLLAASGLEPRYPPAAPSP